MKSLPQTSPAKRPVNLLLNEGNVERARQYTANLSATVDALLAEFVERERLRRDEQRQHYAAVAEAWNRLEALNGRLPTSIRRYEPVRCASQRRAARGADSLCRGRAVGGLRRASTPGRGAAGGQRCGAAAGEFAGVAGDAGVFRRGAQGDPESAGDGFRAARCAGALCRFAGERGRGHRCRAG